MYDYIISKTKVESYYGRDMLFHTKDVPVFLVGKIAKKEFEWSESKDNAQRFSTQRAALDFLTENDLDGKTIEPIKKTVSSQESDD
jgi:hypothetical protein